MNWASRTIDKVSAFSLNGMKLDGRVVDIYDGDTMTVVLDPWGIGAWKFQVRVDGIDTCELRSKDLSLVVKAKEARGKVAEMVMGDGYRHDILIRQLLNGKDVYMVTVECGKFDKYGRLLGKILCADGRDVGQTLLECGLARIYDGGKKESWEI
jgi:endonuclease YncB( thermonuclease family)